MKQRFRKRIRRRTLQGWISISLLISLGLILTLIVTPVSAQTAQPAPDGTPPVETRAAPASPSSATQPANPDGATPAQKAEQAARLAEMKREAWWLRFWAYSLVIIGGAHGGLIYGISRNRGVIIPHFQSQQRKADSTTFTKLDLGYLGDMLVGIGGGIIIFNLIPQTDPDIFVSLFKNSTDVGKIASLLMKVLALSLIGGFAGISLFDEAAKRISQELEEVRSQANATTGLINNLQGENDLESEIQYLLNPMVDPSFPPLTESQHQDFKKAILKAPLYLRNKVFERLQTAHNEHLISGNDPPLSKPEVEIRMSLQQSLITGFDSLIAASEEQEKHKLPADLNKHRYLAHSGFIHDQIALGYEALGLHVNTSQHWRQGEDYLDRAIALRDTTPANKDAFWYYNFERMLCRFKLGNRDQVISELNEESTLRWFQKEPGVVYTQIKIMPADFLDFLRAFCKDRPQLSEFVARFPQPAAQPPAGSTQTSQARTSEEPGSAAEVEETPTLTTLQRIRRSNTL